MKQIQIHTTNKKDRKNLLTILHSFGSRYIMDSQTTTVDDTCQYGDKFPYTIVYSNKSLGGNYQNYGPGEAGNVYEFPEQFTEIYDILTNEYVTFTIEDVGDYDAIVTKDNVKVGCQNISHEKVIEIYEAIQKVKTLS